MLNNKIIKIIKNDAIDLDWDVAFNGKSKGNRHLFRVNKIIKYLLRREGGNINITMVGGWIHDVSLAWGSDYDEKFVEKHTRKFLKKYKEISSVELNKIIECAVLHESEGKSSSIEAKIVHDADIIDKSGSLGVIRHIWKMTNMLENRVLDNKKDLNKLRSHLQKRRLSLYTETAQSIVKKLNKNIDLFFAYEKQSLNTLKEISKLAYKGKTSDSIARKLIKNEKNNFSKLLKQQLSCTYLSKIIN